MDRRARRRCVRRFSAEIKRLTRRAKHRQNGIIETSLVQPARSNPPRAFSSPGLERDCRHRSYRRNSSWSRSSLHHAAQQRDHENEILSRFSPGVRCRRRPGHAYRFRELFSGFSRPVRLVEQQGLRALPPVVCHWRLPDTGECHQRTACGAARKGAPLLQSHLLRS